ncbi:hypothetical protein [Allorhizobium ampelinum]|uniref:hypothetical protein n=1 Tax=Allorhizobium ampelinum TaxID=3025782 RepID=UPI000B402C0F|nr:hypothetical protein [Allorhizobium ampelinum]NTA27376.1 hypothetical protein [Allorhizobium ampelinum]OVE94431.1 hypothetical protein B7W85_12840 [Allorhizobium ampelinum]
MVEITDITKLRPELLDLSDAEIERRVTELNMLKEHRAYEVRRKALDSLVYEANSHIEKIIDGLRFLDKEGLLPDSVRSAFSTDSGSLMPHLKLRMVDADRILARQAKEEKPVRKRRKKAEA